MARSNCPGGGLFVVEGEVSLLMTAMRRGVRWSSHSHQDEDQDALMKGLSTLKETLNDVKHLSELEPGVFMAPFLEIIRSEEITGPVTCLALSAVNKIISYGLLDSEHPAIAPCVEAIADAVTRTRFVGTDSTADGVALMKILQVLRSLVLSPPGDNLSNESMCEVLLSCFRICLETRLSELLRRTAEHCLRDIVQHLFVRLPQFVDDMRGQLSMKKMRTNSLENTKNKTKKSKISNVKPKSKSNLDDIDDPETPLMSPVARVKSNHLATTPTTPVGNIVDMQGCLNQANSEKVEDDKKDNTTGESKSDSSKDNNKDDVTSETNQSEVSKESENSEAPKNETEAKGSNLENKEPISSSVNDKQVEGKACSPVIDSSKQIVSGNSDNQTSADFVRSPIGSVEDLSVDDANNGAKGLTAKVDGESVEEYVNSQGVRFMTVQQHAPYGSPCIRELFRFLVSLCSPLDKQNTEIMMHLGLSLLQVTLEVAADALSNFPSLLALAKDDLSRSLILLLGTDRLSILAANMQVSFLLFESQREHLKFQFEQFIVKLMELANTESNKIFYEQRELALETLVRLWKIPGLPTELFINYDCGLYSVNLYEELMKMLSKNASTMTGSMYSMQFISLDAIFTLIANMEARFKGHTNMLKPSRHSAPLNLPSREELLETKTKKRWLAVGSEKFNENPRKGIAKLAEHGLLGDTPGNPNPDEIVKFLRENPTLDKKAIGEYISKKENTKILNSFVNSFDFENTRIDVAVRQYVETFRLPGEAPLISLLLETFAEHWHESNNRPFASAEAAYILAYAIIILNTDQHNHNAKRLINPMTAEDFKKNVKNVNGGANFDQDMLDEVYTAIKNEEIVMPAEQTGLIKENYLWKCLLRRSASPESVYVKVGDAGVFIDKELAERAWAPIISALCKAYDKAPDRTLQRKVAQSFLSCAAISAHYGMTSDLDTLIVSLCKFTGLAAAGGQPDQIVLKLGGSGTCQLATRTLFKICHLHGNALRASWKNMVDCLQMLLKAKLLPKDMTEGEDFLDPSGKVNIARDPPQPKQPPVEQSILSSLYSYITSDTSRSPHPAEAVAKKRALECVAHCYLKQIIEESNFLEVESLQSLVTALISANSSNDEGTSVFLLELLLETTIQNCDRVSCIWPAVHTHLESLLTMSARDGQPFLLERVTIGMLRLAIRLLRSEELACTVLPPLMPLTQLPSAAVPPLARQISFGLFELLKIGAANIHSTEDWKVVFNLLECSGAGALQPKPVSNAVMDETMSGSRSPITVLDQRSLSPVPEWVLVSPTGTEAPLPVAADTIVLDRDLQTHDPASLIKCCESLTFLVRDVAHVTPFNFELCVRCVRTFAEAVLCPAGKRSRIPIGAEEPPAYQQMPIQLLDLMHTLHTKTAQVFRWWAEESSGDATGVDGKNAISTASLWSQAWRPLLQGIARLCCDSRRAVRAAAITSLQSTLLAHDLSQLSAIEWSQCLEQVLFPLLAQLLGPIASKDPLAVEETRVRAAMLLSKVFLHHLNPLLTLPGFLPIWLTVLDLLRSYMHADKSEMLYEAIPESLKNMLLVMASAGVLQCESYLWTPTWRAIDAFLPNLKAELFPEPVPSPPPSSPPQSQSPTNQMPPQSPTIAPQSQSPTNQVTMQHPNVISLVDQQELTCPIPIPASLEDQHQQIQQQQQQQLYMQHVRQQYLQQQSSSPMSQSPLSEATVGVLSTSPGSQETPQSISPPEQSFSPIAIGLTQVEQPTSPFKIVRSSLVLEAKEPQQVITFVSQPPPSVASPVAVQPTTQLYRPVPQKQQQQQTYHLEDSSAKEQQQHQPDYREQTISIKETGSPAHLQYTHLPQMQVFHSELYGESGGNSADCANKAEMSTSDTTMIFNSAAYFSEDSAADRLFVVTNP
ncbi:Golgi-specific brefeldin A-resistance guanine nucleotide exchange factor 1 isoform X2 [Copidosoma floridanum]|uniref:Golgi-specific brefeldin A-resistance guanine nucleotide exchange factor 1 isoform X2 n=1 Tax=Copidosoma floridanum TaxID=29053 RepID=UPI0006C996B9|nr:Golgi-specific brefeldin A-resistance guanine nucleotide exchange factor 1 isoform X2 [Copidosoma floridanum]